MQIEDAPAFITDPGATDAALRRHTENQMPKHPESFAVYRRASSLARWCVAQVDGSGQLYGVYWFETKGEAIAWAQAHPDGPTIVGGPSHII